MVWGRWSLEVCHVVGMCKGEVVEAGGGVVMAGWAENGLG